MKQKLLDDELSQPPAATGYDDFFHDAPSYLRCMS
jgi:hypothetical protein